MTSEPSVLLSRDGNIATLTLNRPRVLNTLDPVMMEALVVAIDEVARDDALRVVVICGAGPHFMAGGDLRSFAEMLEHGHDFKNMITRLHGAIELIQRMPHPVVAAVHGAVAGFGLSLMCAADIVLAADNSYFSSAYRNIGLTPDGGGTWSLPRIVGLRKALEIVLLAERFDVAEALRIGLVNRVVPASDLEASTATFARALAEGPVAALRGAKRLLRESPGHSLSMQLDAEATAFARCAATADFAEGIAAFLAKRPARFGQVKT